MPNIDTTNILQNFLKNDPHFNSDEIIKSNRTCFDEDTSVLDDTEPTFEEDDLIVKINEQIKSKTKENDDTPPELVNDSTATNIVEELVSEEPNNQSSPSQDNLEPPNLSNIPMTKEERMSAILKQRSLEEKIERERIAFQEELKKKEEELNKIKEQKQKRITIPFFSNKKDKKEKTSSVFEKEKDVLTKPRQRDNIDEEKLRALALFDQKLHCKNANAFGLEVSLPAVPAKDSLVFIFCDVNNLKKINDSVGHEGGDKLLSACVNKFIARFTDGQVYRVGGDEFCIFYHPSQTEVKTIEQMLEEDLLSLSKENPLYSFSYGYSVSDGIKNISDLQKEADAKMYTYKEAYKSSHVENIPQNDRIKTVKDIISQMVLEFKRNEDNIANIFLCTYKDQLFIFDTTLDFFDQLEDNNYEITGKNQIKYCLITYEDNPEEYLIFSEEPLPENPYPGFKALDKDIRASLEFTARDIKRHKELYHFKEIYLS